MKDTFVVQKLDWDMWRAAEKGKDGKPMMVMNCGKTYTREGIEKMLKIKIGKPMKKQPYSDMTFYCANHL